MTNRRESKHQFISSISLQSTKGDKKLNVVPQIRLHVFPKFEPLTDIIAPKYSKMIMGSLNETQKAD